MRSLRIAVLLGLWVVSSSRLQAQLTPADEPEFYGTDIYFHDWNQTNHTIDGYDWSMPAWVVPESNSAIMHTRRINGKPADEMLRDAGFRGNLKRTVSWNWKKIEPTEGKYEWQPLRDEIDRVSEDGKYLVELRIYAAVLKYDAFNDDGTPKPTPKSSVEIEQSAPLWLKDKGIPTIVGRSRLTFQLTYYDEYDDRYHTPYIAMVEALGRTGILNDDRILNAYVHLGSATRGEEGHGPALDSPDRPKYEERLATWAEAAGEDKHKLMSTSNEVKDLRTAYELGIGQRNGFVENYVLHCANPELGTRVDSEGYLEIDENHPLISGSLASGDENEEYFLTQQMKNRFGDFSTFEHRFMEATLRTLQMRRTTVWCQNTQGFINPPLRQFAALSLAKDVYTTADAWTYLRQNNLKPNDGRNKYVQAQMDVSARNADGSLPVKNFERWLYQRDGGDIKTIPTRKRGEGGLQRARDERHPYEFTARKTDADQGFDRIGFALDDRFIRGRGEVALKVSYVDDGNTQWYLQYTGTDGNLKRKQVANQGTNKMKTITWILQDIAFDATGMDNDFHLVAEQGDLTVSFVRVVKLAAVSTDSNDDLGAIDGPNTVAPGRTYTVEVDYAASANRDVAVQLKTVAVPTISYGFTRIKVPAGSRTAQVSVTLDEDIPPSPGGYQWYAYLMPPGGTWSDRLGDAAEANVAAGANGAATYAIRNVETNLYLRPTDADHNSGITVATNNHSNWFKCYPNAVDDVLNIDSQRAIARLLIYDLQGQLRWSTQKVGDTLSTTHLTDGLYTLKVVFADGSTTSRKLMVRH